jgi:hypothetical protein
VQSLLTSGGALANLRVPSDEDLGTLGLVSMARADSNLTYWRERATATEDDAANLYADWMMTRHEMVGLQERLTQSDALLQRSVERNEVVNSLLFDAESQLRVYNAWRLDGIPPIQSPCRSSPNTLVVPHNLVELTAIAAAGHDDVSTPEKTQESFLGMESKDQELFHRMREEREAIARHRRARDVFYYDEDAEEADYYHQPSCEDVDFRTPPANAPRCLEQENNVLSMMEEDEDDDDDDEWNTTMMEGVAPLDRSLLLAPPTRMPAVRIHLGLDASTSPTLVASTVLLSPPPRQQQHLSSSSCGDDDVFYSSSPNRLPIVPASAAVTVRHLNV